MKKSIVALSMAAMPLAAGFAQEASASEGKRGPYETNKFMDNWFISVDGGVQTYIGGSHEQGAFGKRIAPVFNLSLGKWITPNVGVRAQAGYGKVKGFGYAVEELYLKGEADANGLFKKKYSTITAHADVMYNLSSAIAGYNEKRVYEIIPYIGVGIANSGKSNTELTLNAGLINKFRLSSAWDLNLEMKAAVLNSTFDHVSPYQNMNALTGITVGFTYKFKQRGFKRVERCDYTPYNQRISSLESDVEAANNQIANLKDALAKEQGRQCPEVAPAVASECPVFFRINSSKLTEKDNMNLKLYADAIKASEGEKFAVTGYADKQTGSLKYNEKLALKRAEAVRKVLVDKYGVNADQLVISAGDLNNAPFEKSIYNRVVIVKLAK